MSRGLLIVGALAAVSLGLGCGESKRDLRVDGVMVAQAIGNYVPPEAPTVTFSAGQRPDAVVLPEGDTVRLAIARDVSYGAAKQLVKRAEAAGKKVILLVGERFKLRAIVLNDELGPPSRSIRLVATPEGKACVAPPDNPESKCAEQVYSDHVSTASVREFVREAVNGYGLTDVRVFVRPSVEWADVIRAIDGARTCCDGAVTPRVRLADWDSETAAADVP